MKALEILKKCINSRLDFTVTPIEIEEAIVKLEALQKRTCESCKGYVDFDYCKIIDDDCRLIAALCNGCNRYEPKDKQ